MNPYPLSVDEAQQLVLASVKPLEPVSVPLTECDGLTLAENIAADCDVPLFDRAMMDGFAVIAEDVAAASVDKPVRLQVVEEIAAGIVPARTVRRGEAIRIMTGSMIPEGADAVCRFEATREQFRRSVREVYVQFPVKSGDNIAVRGEDIPSGALVLRQGARIGPAEQAVLATFGKSAVNVYRKPKVAILSTGSELVDADEPLAPGKIRNSNSYMIASMIRRAGGEPLMLRPEGDDAEAIATVLRRAGDCDMFVTSGGVSVGDFDVMQDVYERIGAKTVFWKVLMRPGSPLRFAMNGHVPFFGVSGNPAASFVNTLLFVLPALRRMCGRTNPLQNVARAKLVNRSLISAIKPVKYLRGSACLQEGVLTVELPDGQSSGMIGSLPGANCLVRLKGGESVMEGDMVDILLFDEVVLK